jgi:hypothetical protein
MGDSVSSLVLQYAKVRPIPTPTDDFPLRTEGQPLQPIILDPRMDPLRDQPCFAQAQKIAGAAASGEIEEKGPDPLWPLLLGNGV